MKNVIKNEIIKDFMQSKRLSKNKFCKMCKISPYTFDKIMEGDTNFGIVALFKIARVLKINICDFF